MRAADGASGDGAIPQPYCEIALRVPGGYVLKQLMRDRDRAVGDTCCEVGHDGAPGIYVLARLGKRQANPLWAAIHILILGLGACR